MLEGEASPALRALSDLREQVIAPGVAEFLPILADLACANLKALQDKLGWLDQDRLPDLASYLALRADDISVHPMAALHRGDLAPGCPTGPAGVLLGEITRLMMQLATLANDLIGLPRDLVRPEFINAACVLAFQCDVPVTTGYRMALTVAETLRQRLDRLVDAVRALPPHERTSELVRQAELTARWADGVHTWTATARCYREAGALTARAV